MTLCVSEFNFASVIILTTESTVYTRQLSRIYFGGFFMAETIHLYLKAAGQPICGESTQHSLERKDSIECFRLTHEVSTPREGSAGLASGRREYSPLRIRKRIDKSSPLLFKALVENQNIEASFKFFRPSPDGNGQSEQFYTISIQDARIERILQVSEAAQASTENSRVPIEDVSFVFNTITATFMPNGVTHEDSWLHNR